MIAIVAASAAATAADAAPAASDSRRARATRVVLAPTPGQLVRVHFVRMRVRAGNASVLRVRLNGTPLGADFGRARNGVRRLRASVSHGLRRGRNVLRVTVRRPGRPARRTTVRFVVRTRRPLVGAGRNRTVAIGGDVLLDGRVDPRGQSRKVRWKVIRTPARTPLRRAVRPNARRRGTARSAQTADPLASLTDPVTDLPIAVPPATTPDADDAPALGPVVQPANPAGTVTAPANLAASFQAVVPGQYTLRLTVGSGAQATSDLVTIDATPRNKLVPIATMTPGNQPAGIQVGDATFLLGDAVGRPSPSAAAGSYLQAVVLDRRTTGFVWNRKYADVYTLSADLQSLDSTKLVILVQQPSNNGSINYGPLENVVGQIGVPGYPVLPKDPGTISAIGVPGMTPGQGDVNIQSYYDSPMQGYLTPDLYDAFTFVPSGRVPFSYTPSPSDPCVNNNAGGRSCNGQAGFFVRQQNSRTLAPGEYDSRFYATGTPGGQTTAEAARMAADLAKIPSEDVVTIRSVSFLEGGPTGTQYGSAVAGVDKATMGTVTDAVAKLGGSRNAFNLAAHTQVPASSGGAAYTMIGWQGADEGAAAEAMVGVDGVGAVANLSGILRPDERSRYRPAQVKPTDYAPDLTDVLFAPPTRTWPLDDDPRASLALSYLGTLDPRLGPDPRSAYWRQAFPDATTWDILADEIRGARYTDVPPSQQSQFTQADFATAQRQLVQELRWVGNVRAYLDAVARPFSANALSSWKAAELIADRIYSDAYRPDGDVAETWLRFTEIMLDLLGPLTDDVSTAVADLMELGTWAFDTDAEGRPSGADLKIQADQVAATLSDQMADAARSYWSVGSVIVSDYAKLSRVGPLALCNPGPGCPDQYSFSQAQSVTVSGNLARSVERVAYEKLYPLGYHVFRLNPDVAPARVQGQPRDPSKYHCGYYHPWSEYSATATRYATSALLQQYDPQGPNNGWQVLAMARPPSGTTVHGQPPSDATLTRMFGPVPVGDPDPKDGGLGISPTALMREAEPDWDYWSPASYNRPTYDTCYWDD